MKSRSLAAVLCGACLLFAGQAAPGAEAVPAAHDAARKAAAPAPFRGGKPDLSKIQGVGADPFASTGKDVTAQTAGCKPDTGVDNPHVSKNKVDVSGHGWWNKGSCHKNSAWVTEWLLEYYSDGTWRVKDYARQSLPPYRTSGKRTNVRRTCANNASTGWMNLVDVDVRGEADDATRYYRSLNVGCRVY